MIKTYSYINLSLWQGLYGLRAYSARKINSRFSEEITGKMREFSDWILLFFFMMREGDLTCKNLFIFKK